MKKQMTGSYAVLESLKAEGVDTIFGYPGGAIIPIYDALYDYSEIFNHILVRHEQAAAHAAEGYARVSGKPGVVFVTSGPGATNTITGIADAMMDSTPIIVISAQVASPFLGTDAFQETDLLGLTQPITKWSYQIRKAEDIPDAIARAFYIACTGRPGPVVLDITKDALLNTLDYQYKKCDSIRSYIPDPEPEEEDIEQAACIINSAQRPLAVIGQGVLLAHAEEEVKSLLEKAQIPVASTLLGLSALPSDYPLYKGMVGMHGNLGPNIKTNECDVLIAIGMRFSDRVTGNLKTYAKQAKVIHFDIDPSEIGKNVVPTLGVLGNVKETIPLVTEKVKKASHDEWIASFGPLEKREYEHVYVKEVEPSQGPLHMGEVVRHVSDLAGRDAVLVTDVGQNQMMGSRYFRFGKTRSNITSGGLGTMGYGIPAALGAKIGAPERRVCLFLGDGGLQMTLEEFGTIMQDSIGVKIILLNNNKLGMVRQWQELFNHQRYSFTDMANPDFCKIAEAYGIRTARVERREDLDKTIQDMFSDDKAFLLVAECEQMGMVYPMTPAGANVTDVMLEK